jgi:hypothetical protein
MEQYEANSWPDSVFAADVTDGAHDTPVKRSRPRIIAATNLTAVFLLDAVRFGISANKK